MYEYYRAVLAAVREGLVLVDTAGRVQLVNDEARRLLRLPDDVVGQSLADLGLPPGMVEAAAGGTASRTRSTSWASTCCSSARPPPTGRAPRWVPWSPCATAPSSRR